MTRLVLTERIDQPPAIAWRYLTEPELMSRWSKARIELIEPGDEGRADAIGALRVVHLQAGSRKLRLEEVVQAAEAPARLVYRVVANPWVSEHRGCIAIGPAPAGGSTIEWTVEFEMSVPGIGFLVGRALERELTASLAELARIAEPIAPATCQRPMYDEPDSEHWEKAEEVLEVQRALADRLEREGDPRRWFSRVYQFVTENQLAFARQRKTMHVAWVLRLLPVFHRYYADNLEARLAGRWCEPPWRLAFDAMEGKIGRRRDLETFRIGYGLLKGIRAHIEEDLPRALAEVWVEHYRGRCDYARLRADYLLMSGIFDDATDRMTAEMPKSMTPWYAEHLPRELKGEWRRRRFYDVGRARRLAFERGARLAGLIERVRGSRLG